MVVVWLHDDTLIWGKMLMVVVRGTVAWTVVAVVVVKLQVEVVTVTVVVVTASWLVPVVGTSVDGSTLGGKGLVVMGVTVRLLAALDVVKQLCVVEETVALAGTTSLHGVAEELTILTPTTVATGSFPIV